jgi:hypothetical protein
MSTLDHCGSYVLLIAILIGVAGMSAMTSGWCARRGKA